MKKLYFIIFLILSSVASQAQWTRWNWEKLKLPAQFENGYFLGIHFLKSNTKMGWVCGYNGYVLRTTDGGNSWTGVQIPNAPQLESIIFLNEQVGYCSGTDQFDPRMGGVYKTVDGGFTWNEITPIISVNGVIQRAHVWGCNFINENIGIVVGGGCGQELQQFYRTTDGGASWNVFTANQPNTGLSHVKIFSEVGDCYASSSGNVWKSTDGGKTWRLFVNTGPQYWQENLKFSNRSVLVATAGRECIGGGAGAGDIRFSSDFGTSWRTFDTGEPMFGTFLLNDSTGWAVGFNRSVYRTSNYGKTWKPFRCGLAPQSNFDDLFFINDTLGYVIGSGIYRATDRDLLEPLIVSSSGNFTLCDSIPIQLSVAKADNIGFPYTTYVWSTGEMKPVINVSKPGVYFVRVLDDDSCRGASLPVTVVSHPSPKPQLVICEGSLVELISSVEYPKYSWSTGQNTQSITVSKSGIYTLTVADSLGCTGISRSVPVVVHPIPKPKITSSSKNNHLCKDDVIVLKLNDTWRSIQWSGGDSANSISIKTPGKYFLSVIDTNGCSGRSDTITITGGDIVPKIFQSAPTRFCEGDSITLSAEGGFKQYLWSNQSDKNSITVGQTGSYFVTVVDSFGCVWKSDVIDVIVDTNPLFIVNLPNNLLTIDSTLADEIVCDSIIIRNLSNSPIQISKTQLFRNIEFSVPQSQIVMDIPANAEKGLRVCYKPSELLEQQDTLIIGDYCKRIVFLSCVGVANRYSSTSRCDVPFRAITKKINTIGLNISEAFPNPASDRFTMLLQSQNMFVVSSASIVDAMGREVQARVQSVSPVSANSGYSQELVFDVSGVTEGIYYLRLGISGEFFYNTLVISK